MINTLFLFTASYPFGKSETFIDNEIEILCKSFNKVYICPKNINDGKTRSLPKNVEIIYIQPYVNDLNIIQNIIYTINRLLFTIKDVINSPSSFDNIRYRFANDKEVYARYYNLKKYLKINDHSKSTFYSYWFEDWATILSELKRYKCIDSFISRAHGFDVYEERRMLKFIPFRQFQLKMVDELFLISRDGYDYMVNKYPKYSSKYFLSYLGTMDFGLSYFNPTNSIEILSISNIIPVKRLYLIVEALKKTNVKINWTHFGDGVMMNEIIKQCDSLPNNVSYSFEGRIPNIKMMNYIKNHHFDIFINVSESEGLPVSIMEVISFGIPVFATDVGGTKEIVNDHTGKLYPINVGIEEFANDINSLKKSVYSTDNFRYGVRKFWQNNYLGNKNYTSFVNSLVDNN